jgi:drug/metabolite transporter (DMT)-like permease
MVLIWAGNYSLVKAVIGHIPPLAFNGLRLTVASLVFGAGWWLSARGPAWMPKSPAPLTGADWRRLVGLGVVGHFGYQVCFIEGIARTSVSNSALISGCSPVAIAILSAVVGHERIGRTHWMGAVLSLLGIYLVAGRGMRLGTSSLAGDALILLSVGCWAVYTVFSKPLLARHMPLVVTSATMIVGSAVFLPFAWPDIASTRWATVDWTVLAAIGASALLALNVAYLIWYTAVQRIGSARTSVFSNMVPPTAMVIAALVIGERLDAVKWLGAVLVVAGVALTRLAPAPVET